MTKNDNNPTKQHYLFSARVRPLTNLITRCKPAEAVGVSDQFAMGNSLALAHTLFQVEPVLLRGVLVMLDKSG